MKKIRLALFAAAVLAGVTAAVAQHQFDCSNRPQYYLYKGQFYPAGVEGVDFVCGPGGDWGMPCTYYYDAASNKYRPCKYGLISFLR